MKISDIPYAIKKYIGELREIHFPVQGHTSVVISITTRTGNFILKRTSHPLYNDWLKKEFQILKQLEKSTLPIPKAFLYAEEEGQCWLLMSQFKGIRLREYLFQEQDDAKRKRVISQFGEILRDIHTSLCPPALITEEPWLSLKLREAEYNFENYTVDGTRELLHQLISKQPQHIPNVLIHGDFTIDNVMVDDNNIVGVIDWGGAAFGDPRYDLALAIRPKPNVFQKEIDRHWFFEAYRIGRISTEEFEYYENGLYQFF